MKRAWGVLLVTCAACGGDSFGTGPESSIDGGAEAGATVEAAVTADDASDAGTGRETAYLTGYDAGFVVRLLDGAPVDPDDSSSPEASVEAAPTVDAGQTPPVEAACTPVTHNNGLGGHWTDCVPFGTTDEAQAMAACESYAAYVGDGGGCHATSFACGAPATPGGTAPTAYVVTGGGTGHYWGYASPVAGLVGTVCAVNQQCASACFGTEASWN